MSDLVAEKALRRRMEAIGLEGKEVAEIAGVHENTVSRVLNGKIDPRLSTVRKIENAIAAKERELAAYLSRNGDAA